MVLLELEFTGLKKYSKRSGTFFQKGQGKGFNRSLMLIWKSTGYQKLNKEQIYKENLKKTY